MFLSATFDQPVCPLRNLARRVSMVTERPVRPALKMGWVRGYMGSGRGYRARVERGPGIVRL
jgi:hypothetical protein